MRLVTAKKTLSVLGLDLIDIVMSGEAALMAGCDRRTFKGWAKRLNVKPVGTLKGNKEVYKRADAERVARSYKAFLERKTLNSG